MNIEHQLDIPSLVSRLEASFMVAVHDPNLAAMFTCRLSVLQRGEFVAIDPPQAVLSRKLIVEIFKVDAHVEGSPIHGRCHVGYRIATQSRPGCRGTHQAPATHIEAWGRQGRAGRPSTRQMAGRSSNVLAGNSWNAHRASQACALNRWCRCDHPWNNGDLRRQTEPALLPVRTRTNRRASPGCYGKAHRRGRYSVQRFFPQVVVRST